MCLQRCATLCIAALLSVAVLAAAQAPRGVAPKPSFSEPSFSPDGSQIAFVSGGDIWTVPASGGGARLLVSHPATESRPLFSPDGKYLAFASTRTGNGDVYLLTLASGELKRITYDDAPETLDAWSRDGKWIYFSSASKDISGMADIFRVPVAGGTPMAVTSDRYAGEYFAAPSPDGAILAFTGTGMAGSQWWRKGHSHIDEGQIWLLRDAAQHKYERLSEGGAKEAWPMWSADGRTLYYMSDRGGAQNIWARAVSGKPRQVTKFTDGRVVWPSISLDGRSIVFERNFGIWRADTASGQSREVPIRLEGTPAGPAVEHARFTSGIGSMVLSPDGKKIAFITHGEVFAASAKDGGDAARVTRTTANEEQVIWAPDSRRVVYVSDRDGPRHLMVYDFEKNQETSLEDGANEDYAPSFAPDGKTLAFLRNGKEVCVRDLESKQVRVVARGLVSRPPFVSQRAIAWSPDSKWLAYFSTATKGFENVYIAPVAGGESRQVSFVPNGNAGSLCWSPDGTYVLFLTAQRTEASQVARVDLLPRTPRFREDQFRDLFKPDEKPKADAGITLAVADASGVGQEKTAPEAKPAQKKAEPKPVRIVFEGIRERLSLLPVGIDANDIRISPDGKTLLLSAQAAGQNNLYTWSLDELAREAPVARQLTSTPGYKRDGQFTPDSKEVFYIESGGVRVIGIEARQPRPIAVTAEMDVDFNAEKMEAFEQAWKSLRDWFFDPGMNDVNWNTVHEQYAPQIAGSRTPDEMRRLLSLMVGELNASHLGVSGPPSGDNSAVGRLGLRFDRVEYETNGRLRVTEVIAQGPAAIGVPGSAADDSRPATVNVGDYVLAVDGTPTGPGVNLDELLQYKVGRRVALSVAAQPDGPRREVAVRPVNGATEKRLLYRQWVENNRAYVERISNGRLGYVHMPDMGSDSLAQLYIDLDTGNHSREGVVIDVRNNNGGFVNAYALDVLSRRHYLTMTERGYPPAPARSMLGQRALELPTVLVTNKHSLSDAEDFTEGYRALKLGKVVGEPTAGWIIYTSGVGLIDGSMCRLPTTRITGSDGAGMEMNPRPVDVLVERPVGESYTGADSQIDAAVRELLKQLPVKK